MKNRRWAILATCLRPPAVRGRRRIMILPSSLNVTKDFSYALDTMIELSEGTMSIATLGNARSHDWGTSVFEC
jgi:hypothetical protein